MAALVQEDVTHGAGVTELSALWLPLRNDNEVAVQAVNRDGGVVGSFEDGHLSLLSVGCAEKWHANAVSTIRDEVHRRDCRIIHRIRDALVHGNHQVIAGLAKVGMREPNRRRHVPASDEFHQQLRNIRLQAHGEEKVQTGAAMQQRAGDEVLFEFCAANDAVAGQRFLLPRSAPAGRPRPKSCVCGMETHLQGGIAQPQGLGKVRRAQLGGGAQLQKFIVVHPDRAGAMPNQPRLDV